MLRKDMVFFPLVNSPGHRGYLIDKYFSRAVTLSRRVLQWTSEAEEWILARRPGISDAAPLEIW